jgi:hypothetical protein
MVNLVRVLTTSTGTSTMTLGTAYSQLFMTPAEAGMVDGRTYTYLIVEANNWELGKGVYTASGTQLSRVTVLYSRISGTLGTTKITLSGTAQVRIVDSADDMGALRGTRTVTGTSDTLAQNDLGGAVTYSNASSIAVSLAQAGASSQFLDGWSAWVQNIGAGTVTITPATSTVNAGATLVLAQNLGAYIWSDGTNYHAYIIPVTKPLLAANNLSELASASTARTNLGLGTTDTFSAKNFAASNTPSSAPTIDASGAATVGTSAALTSSFPISPAAGSYYEVTVSEIAVSGSTAKYFVSSGNTSLVFSTGTWAASTLTPAGGALSVAYSGGTVNIYNNLSTSARFRAKVERLA